MPANTLDNQYHQDYSMPASFFDVMSGVKKLTNFHDDVITCPILEHLTRKYGHLNIISFNIWLYFPDIG